MPELPEVETIARSLKPQVIGKVISSINIIYPTSVDNSSQNLLLAQNQKVIEVKRRAKLLILELSNNFSLAFHFKMTGALLVQAENYELQKHDRVIFTLNDGLKLAFNDIRRFGYVKLLHQDDFTHWKFYAKLGLEPLESRAEDFIARLKNKNAQIKAELLKQDILCGIGNIYADEALFNSSLLPTRKIKDISHDELIKLFNEVQKVLELSIQECGSSIKDYKDANGNAGAFQNMFNVYGRAGQECKKCKKTIQSQKVAGRTSAYCTHCQK